MSVDRLLTTRDVAEMLAVSPETVLRRWRAGELAGFRLAPNVLRFRAEDVDAWLGGKRRGEELTPISTTLAPVVAYAPPISTTEEEHHAR